MSKRAVGSAVKLPHRDCPMPIGGFICHYCRPTRLICETSRAACDQFGPRWYHRLLALRNLLVKPFGLKTDADLADTGAGTIGPFPITSETDQSVILGLDDHHLNFRIVFETEAIDAHRTLVRSITLVRRNNALGRAYLAAVMPFHNRIVPAMLNAAYGR